jgi:hypothetical protein
MIIAPIPVEDAIPISLRYDGPDVAAGEMDISEVIAALQGFSGAYAKVASDIAPNAYHQLKVTAVREGSFDLLIAAGMYISQAGGLGTIKSGLEAAKAAFDVITGVISLKKHTEGKRYEFNVNGKNNTVNVTNIEKVEIAFPVDVFRTFVSKSIDDDISKIVEPLNNGHVDIAELKHDGMENSSVRVDSSEKSYFFQKSDSSVREVEVAGTLISLNKKTNRGTFEFGNGHTARYLYIGEDKDRFHNDFSVKGQVKVRADVTFDENLNPLHLNIKRVERSQLRLDLGQ